MAQTRTRVGAILVTGCCLLLIWTQIEKGHDMQMLPHVTQPQQLSHVFPHDADTLTQRTHDMIEHVRERIDQIAECSEDASFVDTFRAFDRAVGALQGWGASLHVLQMASPDATIRDTAYNEMIRLEEFAIEHIEYNLTLYQALKACGERLCASDIASHRARYIRHTLDGFTKRGLDLAGEERQQAMDISKQLVQKTMQFDANINQDDSSITATSDQLQGLSDQFIQSLETTDDGVYKLGTDYPTYQRVMENCSVADTRYRMWRAFANRAYPQNRELLKNIIALRDQFAQKVGYQDYAHLDIDEEEMAENPETVSAFVSELLHQSQEKWQQEFAQFTRHLPASVELDEKGRLKPWDVAFVKNAYKKAYHEIDETQLMEYFPLDHTLHQLLSIYETFFGVTCKTVSGHDLWHEDVWCVQAYYNGSLMGHIVMDLFPRENKYSHAAQIGVVPRFHDGDTTHSQPGVVFLVANFPKPQGDQPALLKRDDVMTFFHEFGHVLHTLFGATEMIGQAGTNVATDFVELPSQMLEEWLYDADILKQVSSHYTRHESLPDDMMSRIQGLQTYDAGFFVQRQVALSRMSLSSFAQGGDKDPDAVFDAAFGHMHDYIMPSDENHFYAAFGHLTGYGAKYYSYLWSKVYAIDVFSHIDKHGLLNPDIGQAYARNVLMQGDSVKPMTLLENFLGRSPSRDAFYQYYTFKG